MEKKLAAAALLLAVSFLLLGCSAQTVDHPECSDERLASCPIYCPVYCKQIGFPSFTCAPEGAPTTYCCCTGHRVPTPFRP